MTRRSNRSFRGGRWQTSSTVAGNYRVVVRRQGSEQVRRYASLTWIEDRGAGRVIGHTVNLNELAHVYALANPVIIRRGATWVLQMRAATAPLAPYDRVVEFVLGDPETAMLVRSPAPAA